jgi:acyl-CoA dehydrogenase
MVARFLMAREIAHIPDGCAIVLAAETSLIPCGAFVTHALVEKGDAISLVECSPLGGDVFGTGSAIDLAEGATIATVRAAPGTLMLAAGAVTSALMAGAMARVLEMSLRYAGERQQFGRPLGKFQAIQQQLAVLAEQVISSQVAARTAFSGKGFELAKVAAAKCRTSEAATQVCAISHAVHGAIGATAEFDLQLYTRRLKQWQVAFGSDSYWAERLGNLRIASGCETTADFIRTNLAYCEA